MQFAGKVLLLGFDGEFLSFSSIIGLYNLQTCYMNRLIHFRSHMRQDSEKGNMDL